MDDLVPNDQSALVVIGSAERLVGEERSGGAWIDRTFRRPVLGIGIVAPTRAEVAAIRETARAAGWAVTIDAVKYSRDELISFYDGLPGPSGDKAVGFGWDAKLNKVVVSLSEPDASTLEYFRAHIPEDALLFRFVQGRATALPGSSPG